VSKVRNIYWIGESSGASRELSGYAGQFRCF
jgi:hypothetical protein